MKLIIRALVALALIAGLSPAFSQVPNFPQTMPSDSFVGRIQPGSGPSSAIPIAALLARIATPNSISNSVLFKAPAATIKGNQTGALANVQDFTIQGLPARGAPDANNDKVLLYDNATGLFKYVTPGLIAAAATSGVSSIDGVVNALTVQSGSLKVIGSQLSSNTLASRTFAITQNLSSFSAVATLGYGAPADGGRATFKNIGAGDFIDSFITSFTITGGSGYANNSYFGVIWQLPAGGKPWAIGTATVAGGIVTAVNISGTPGNLCHVGDVYTTPTIPGGSGASITVTGCSTPLASFTDSVGTHFQYVVDENNFPNIKQFGCKGDWANSDATATDNFNCIQAGLWYAGYSNTRDVGPGAGGWVGNTLITPQGSFMACGGATTSLVVPQGVYFRGVSTQASILKMCDGFSSAQHFVTLGDNNWHFACLDNRIMDMQITASRSVSSGAYLVYSRCLQDFGGSYNTYFYAGGRGCFWFEHGDGGSSTVFGMHISCNIGSNGPAIRIGDSVASGLNFGSTIVKLTDIIIGGPSSAPFQVSDGILIQGGILTVEDIHCENVAGGCIVLDIPDDANKMSARLHNINAGSGNPGGCAAVITLTGNNRSGNAAIGQVQPTSCTHVVFNGQSTGTSYDLPIVTDAKFSPSFTQP